MSLLERFEDKYIPEPNSGCDLWVAATTHNGYGQIKVGTSCVRAHRFSWELNVGPIPDGMHVLHRCDQRLCVRVEHLFLGTDKDNAIDCVNKNRNFFKKRTHCKNGHEYTKENTVYRVGNTRACRSCCRDNDTRYKAKLKCKLKK